MIVLWFYYKMLKICSKIGYITYDKQWWCSVSQQPHTAFYDVCKCMYRNVSKRWVRSVPTNVLLACTFIIRCKTTRRIGWLIELSLMTHSYYHRNFIICTVEFKPSTNFKTLNLMYGWEYKASSENIFAEKQKLIWSLKQNIFYELQRKSVCSNISLCQRHKLQYNNHFFASHSSTVNIQFMSSCDKFLMFTLWNCRTELRFNTGNMLSCQHEVKFCTNCTNRY